VLALEQDLRVDRLLNEALLDVQRELERAGIRDAVESFAATHRAAAEAQIRNTGISPEACRQLLELTAFSVARVS
jgi:hypothetical protein